MGATEAAAIHHVFEADAGDSIVQPYADHFVPLSEATVQLCRNVLGIVGGEKLLFKYVALVVCAKDCEKWQLIEALEDVKKFFASFQGAVRCAHEIEQLINAHAADPHAHAMRAHPLTGYAEFAAIMTMGICEALCDVIGIPGAITKDDKFNFIVNFDPNDRLWPSKQAALWWEERYSRLHHHIECPRRIKATAPSEAEFAEKVDEMLREGAEMIVAKTGQPRPAILDDPEASWIEKHRALRDGALAAGARLYH